MLRWENVDLAATESVLLFPTVNVLGTHEVFGPRVRAGSSDRERLCPQTASSVASAENLNPQPVPPHNCTEGTDFEVDRLRRCSGLQAVVLVEADVVGLNVSDESLAEHWQQMPDLRLLDCIAALGDAGLLVNEPVVRRAALEEFGAARFLGAVIAFLEVASAPVLGALCNLLGASLGGLANLLSGKVKFIPLSLLCRPVRAVPSAPRTERASLPIWNTYGAIGADRYC